MCFLPIGRILKIKGKKALVKFEKEEREVDISLLKDVKLNDKVICAGDVAIERVYDEDQG